MARAWELVGARDTGVLSSIAALVGHERPLSGYRVPDGPAGDEPAGPGDRGGREGGRPPAR